MTKRTLTLCIIHQHPKVLLGFKKRGFGVGRWNGFGGKVEPGETIEGAAVREVREEAGVHPKSIAKAGEILFEFRETEETLHVHVFRADDFEGDVTESEEMKPAWFYVDEIPFAEMWPDDRYWFPLFLQGRVFSAHFVFGANDVILDYSISETTA